MLNGHGDDRYHCKREIVSNFSSNIYSRQDGSVLQKHLCAHLNLIHAYPEPDAHSLAALLSKKHAIDVNNICVTNGATEAIYLIAQTFRKSRTGIVIPTFSEYEDACRIHGHTFLFINHLQNTPSQTKMIWICNPNNPDGHVYDIHFLEEITQRYPHTIFVFDQSYGYFTEKKVWDIQKAADYRNVILIHSMTKQYAVPGLRLGYITAHSSLIENIEKNRMPWSVNGLAIEAGKFLLENETALPAIDAYLEESQRLQEALGEIPGVHTSPTDTHYFLCRLEKRKASELKQYLIDIHGILIRDASNFRGLDDTYFRVATQSQEENDLLLKAIQAWM